jgi:hypothetical protein
MPRVSSMAGMSSPPEKKMRNQEQEAVFRSAYRPGNGSEIPQCEQRLQLPAPAAR